MIGNTPVFLEQPLLLGAVVRKQAHDLAAGLRKGERRARRDRGVDLAACQHGGQAGIGPCLIADAGRQLELDLLVAAGLVDARLQPLDGGEIDPVMLGQKAAHVDACGLRPFGNPDGAALQVLGPADAAIAAHVDRRMAMDPGRKHRDRDHRGITLRGERGVFPEGQLRDVPFEVAGEPKGDFLDRRKHQRRQNDAVDADHSAGDLADMLVVADRQRQIEASRAAVDDDLRTARLRRDPAGAIGALRALDIPRGTP